MATSNISFWKLLQKNKISIPIIQRDYAQGRKEESEKREKFLESILEHVSNQKKMHLDFVYGKVKDDIFYPIDGQQRLTTLFLIHWYFAIKENIDNDQKLKLTRFVYDTRISSREFCKSIVEEEIKIPSQLGEEQFIQYIKKQFWFRSSWNNDPTIKAMLIMIQAIHDKFYSLEQTAVFQQLSEKDNITFEVLDLGAKEFELTDELYIKMNARGKQLTSFENFKANFIQLIDKYFKNAKLEHPIKGEISYAGYFSYKIEKEWTDLFWAFRDEETIVDNKFYSYFEFVAQMCYFRKHTDAKADSFNNSFLQYEDIFQSEDNLLFLFNSLDKIYTISLDGITVKKEKIDKFFQDLQKHSQFFWNSSDHTNLFERIITNVRNEDPRNKILLYTLLSYCIKFDTTDCDTELQKVVRVIRNLLQATRQRNETKYNTNIRINNFGKYWLLLEQFLSHNIYLSLTDDSLNNRGSQISEASLNNEREKATILLKDQSNINEALIGLEELEYFGGLIHILAPQTLYQNYPNYLQFFKEVFDNEIPSSLKLRALLTCDFTGIYTKECRMGEMHYFGKNENWTTILTSENKEVSDSIIEFINKYTLCIGTPEDRLQAIIDNWLKDNSDSREWEYYFIKYPEFTSKRNYYVSNALFQSRILGTEGTNPLVAKHISPYVLTACNKLNDIDICNVNDSYLQYSGNSPLFLKNGLTLTSTEEGWSLNNEIVLSENIRERYQLDENYILREIDNRDRIELAVDFIKDVFRQN